MSNTNKGGKQALPPVGQLYTVSPATRLLEKRRLMYENQEQFMQKKKEFQQAEIAFRAQEKVLRDKDTEIQEQIISFATYLDGNQKQMRKCDDQIERLNEEINTKDVEIKKKQFWHKVLRDKSSRIEKQKKAVEQYEEFLQRVKEHNSDEYNDIKKILERYETLEASQKNLKEEQAAMEQELLARQKKVSVYENEMNTHIMQLNNDIGHKKQEQEQIGLKLNKLKADETDSSLAQLKKIKKLSRVVMAVNALEAQCQDRKENIPGLTEGQKKSLLTYNGRNFFLSGNDIITKPKTFDNYQERFSFSIRQLLVIERYLQDFRVISNEFQAKRRADGQISVVQKISEEQA